MIGGHRLRTRSHLPELTRSRHVAKAMKHPVVETVDHESGFVTRDEIRRRRPSQGDGWRSARRGLEQDQAERIAARRYQQKMYRPVHRHEIVAVFVADELGIRPREARSLGPIADDQQTTAKPLDRVGMIQDVGEVLLSCDSADEPEDHRLSILIA
jgi:hypothetical protein